MWIQSSHSYTATIAADIDLVWRLLGDFTNQNWNPGNPVVTVTPGVIRTPGFIRRLQLPDDTVLHEELVSMGPGHTYTYALAGTAPLSVLDSAITVTACATPAGTEVGRQLPR